MNRRIEVLIAAVCLVIVGLLFSKCSHAQSNVQVCVAKNTWKTIGIGAAYGGGVMLLASGVTVIAAPAGMIAAPITYIVSSTVTGGLIGAGSTASGMIYIENTTKEGIFTAHCIRKALTDAGSEAVEGLKKMF